MGKQLKTHWIFCPCSYGTSQPGWKGFLFVYNTNKEHYNVRAQSEMRRCNRLQSTAEECRGSEQARISEGNDTFAPRERLLSAWPWWIELKAIDFSVRRSFLRSFCKVCNSSGPPISQPLTWQQLSLQSRVIIQASQRRIALLLVVCVSPVRRYWLVLPSATWLCLGGVMFGTSPEDARTSRIFSKMHFCTSVQSHSQTVALKNQYLRVTRHTHTHTWCPLARIMVIYAWGKKSMQSPIN